MLPHNRQAERRTGYLREGRLETTRGLPPVADVGPAAPFGWLAGGWADLWRAPGPCLVQGVAIAALSAAMAGALYYNGFPFWVLALTCGFVFVAPMLAMGLYEAGRLLERGERPTLGRMMVVKSAVRRDVMYLGLALMLIYLLWGRVAQVVYGISTYRLHKTAQELIDFALTTGEGHNMLVAGTIVGGAIAFVAYALVVISAPMLLDRDTDVFVATATSVRAVAKNPGAMMVWAVLLAVLTLATALTGFAAMIVVFPWLGLASWRAYRSLVPGAR